MRLQFSLRCLESIANGDSDCFSRFMFYYQLFTGHSDIDMHFKELAPLLVMMWSINGHVTTDDLVAEAL